MGCLLPQHQDHTILGPLILQLSASLKYRNKSLALQKALESSFLRLSEIKSTPRGTKAFCDVCREVIRLSNPVTVHRGKKDRKQNIFFPQILYLCSPWPLWGEKFGMLFVLLNGTSRVHSEWESRTFHSVTHPRSLLWRESPHRVPGQQIPPGLLSTSHEFVSVSEHRLIWTLWSHRVIFFC